MALRTIIACVALATTYGGHTDYQQWFVRMGMYNDYPGGYSDWTTAFGVREESKDRYDSWDLMHLATQDPEHDTAWIYVADRGGNGGWNEDTGQYEDYPRPGLMVDFFAPFGPGTDDPDTLMKVWAVEVHAPNVGYTWRLRWQINLEDPGWWTPDPPFAIRIRPNETFPEGLDLTANGAGYFWITDLPQWGPEPRIWLIEAGIVPEPPFAWLSAALAIGGFACLRRRRPDGRRAVPLQGGDPEAP
jgi:hypothetical protein